MPSKTLIIGAHTGGIGDNVLQWYKPGDQGDNPTVFAPTVDELDVCDTLSIQLYMRKYGPFDRIYYSAGISKLQWIANPGRPFAALDLLTPMTINAFGPVLVARYHIMLFPEHRVRYAVVVSDAADTPMRGSIAYCMSKAAEEMAVRCMARELYPLFTVVGVSPGVVEGTPMTSGLDASIPDFRGWSAEEARAYESSTRGVLGRRVKKHEVTQLLLMAAEGPEALNGSILTINGGK